MQIGQPDPGTITCDLGEVFWRLDQVAIEKSVAQIPPAISFVTLSFAMASDKIEQGHGRVVLQNDGSGNVFSELAATYPLKLLSPQLATPNVSVLYILSYGGGLVGGDRISLEVEVRDGSCLAILSQVSIQSRMYILSVDCMWNVRVLPKYSKHDSANVYRRALKRRQSLSSDSTSRLTHEARCSSYQIQ